MSDTIYTSAEQLIGRTPLLELTRIAREEALEARVLVKLERSSIAGSAKDRAARAMLDDAGRRGVLKPGGIVIEPTSGNTGIALAALAAVRGYRLIVVMPENMSRERCRLISAYGAEVVLTEARRGMAGAIEKARELSAQLPGSFIPDQFSNPANAAAHRETTGPEIWNAAGGAVDIFAAGVGTGGTITGVGTFLKGKNPAVQIVAVEPAASPVLSGGAPGSHKIQGIGAGFVPEALDTDIYDGIITVTDGDALDTMKRLAKTEGVFAGISSGAAVWAAVQLAKRAENAGKTIVTLLPDTGERYLSAF
ncbi:MAG: cysteine synthase A [Oscillospiraceae bacterium]|jgi:cysteine synthase A|nr:cysteine synthase A [Oscillospiraceae bacterium]